MQSRILKAFIGILALVISPLLMVVLIGALYVAFHMITGYSMIEGCYSYANFIRSLVPYFPYLSTAPIVILVPILFKKHKNIAFRKNKRYIPASECSSKICSCFNAPETGIVVDASRIQITQPVKQSLTIRETSYSQTFPTKKPPIIE